MKSLSTRRHAFLIVCVSLGCNGGIDDGPTSTTRSALDFTSLVFPFDTFPVDIVNVNSDKCLDVANANPASGTPVDQKTCSGSLAQSWILALADANTNTYQIRSGLTGNANLHVGGDGLSDLASIDISKSTPAVTEIFGLVSLGDGSYEIVSAYSSKCLQIAGASTADGAGVQQFSCNAVAHQRWQLRTRRMAMSLISKNSDKCVDVASASTDDQTNVQQYTCTGGGNQKWYLGPSAIVNGKTYFALMAAHSNKCLDVAGASTADLANVQQLECNGGGNQRWLMETGADGYVTMKNEFSGKCLDVENASTGNWANVQQFSCNGGANQRWFWSVFDKRHVQVVQVTGPSGGVMDTDQAISEHVARANGVYEHYGISLVYDPSQDTNTISSAPLKNLGSGGSYTCPDGSVGSSTECATRYASTWPGKVVVISRPGFGFSGGDANYLAIGELGSSLTPVCGDVPNTQWVAHEFGHYMGLNHTFNGDGDLLSDTRPDPATMDSFTAAQLCLAPHAATGVLNGTTFSTNNPMSYWYNDTVVITPLQATLVRAGALSRQYAPYAVTDCEVASREYGIVPGATYGFAPPAVQSWWVDNHCVRQDQGDTCAYLSRHYGMSAWVTFGYAPENVKQWWMDNNCETSPAISDTCQTASNEFGMTAWVTYGFAPEYVKQWWNSNNCTTSPNVPGYDACQLAANAYRIYGGVTFGYAEVDENVSSWWISANCQRSAAPVFP